MGMEGDKEMERQGNEKRKRRAEVGEKKKYSETARERVQ